MHRLVLALALVPLAFASSAYAQTAPDDVVKTLWCGEAFSALDASQKSQVTSDQQAVFDAYVAAAGKLVDKGTQGYLDAGFTEEQVNKVKSDLVTEVTAVVTGQGQGKFTPDDCNPLLQAVPIGCDVRSKVLGKADSARQPQRIADDDVRRRKTAGA